MAYDFIGLTNDVLVELNEVKLTASTFAGATGFHEQCKTAVNRALQDIALAEDHEWEWLRTEATITLTVGEDGYDNPYTLATDIATIDWDSWFLARDDALTYGDYAKLTRMDLDQWRQLGKPNEASKDAGEYDKPTQVVRTLDNQPVFYRRPDAAYTATYEYFKVTTDMVNDTDTPDVPEQYRRQVVDGALYYAYMFRDNFEQAQLVEKRFKDGVDGMRRSVIGLPPYMRIKS